MYMGVCSIGLVWDLGSCKCSLAKVLTIPRWLRINNISNYTALFNQVLIAKIANRQTKILIRTFRFQ